jgi:hypothetical protein
MPRAISEARQALPVEAARAAGQSGRFRVQLIDAGWGSSGYYPAEMLQRDGATAFPAGTHMYLDHAGYTEQADRGGIRSVRDLAAVTTSGATYNPATQALEADIQVLGPYRDMVSELAPSIGLSITGAAVGEQGEADGRKGLVFSALIEGYSVDFVSHAGRGGRVLQLLEHAARRRAAEGHGLTASDQRDLLRSAVSDSYGADQLYCWVRDYTDDWVVFERSGADVDDLLQVHYTVVDGAVQFSGEPIEVYVHTQYLPVGTTPPAQPVSTTTQEGRTMPEVPEAELRGLRESAARTTTAEQAVTAAEQRAADAESRAAEAERRANLLTAAGVARGRLDTALATEAARALPAAIQDRIRERAVSSLPLTEAGELDGNAFDTQVAQVITAEAAFVATLAEQMGAGRPRGLGGGSTPPAEQQKLAEATTQLTEALKGFGMSDDAAAIAAAGRR